MTRYDNAGSLISGAMHVSYISLIKFINTSFVLSLAFPYNGGLHTNFSLLIPLAIISHKVPVFQCFATCRFLCLN